jgi:hypothetical protein
MKLFASLKNISVLQKSGAKMSDETDDLQLIRRGRRYVYDLPESVTSKLTHDFLSTKTIATPESASDRFRCFEIEGSDPFANIARQVERETFEETFGNDPDCMANEYGPYEESSLFFLAIDVVLGAPAGMLRVIHNSPAGLKTLVDMEDSTKTPTAVPATEVMRYHGIDDLNRCWDGATAAVRPQYRRRLATVHVQVLRACYAAAIRENIAHYVSIQDAPVYRLMRRFLGSHLVPLANTSPFTYMNAPNSQAVYSPIFSSPTSPDALQCVNRRLSEKFREFFADGSSPASRRQL